MRKRSFFDIAQVIKAQAASLLREPMGMPQPCVAIPGNRPFGPFGMRLKLQVEATLLSLAPNSVRNRLPGSGTPLAARLEMTS